MSFSIKFQCKFARVGNLFFISTDLPWRFVVQYLKAKPICSTQCHNRWSCLHPSRLRSLSVGLRLGFRPRPQVAPAKKQQKQLIAKTIVGEGSNASATALCKDTRRTTRLLLRPEEDNGKSFGRQPKELENRRLLFAAGEKQREKETPLSFRKENSREHLLG